MNKRPISIIIDDPAPGIHVYHHHISSHLTEDGRPLLPTVPNDFLFSFCDVIERNNLKGKFSVIPMAGGQGSLKDGFTGVSKAETDQWIETVRARVMPRFAICSEILTHHYAYDGHGGFLPENEQEWVRTHSRQEIADYVALSLRLLDEAGLTPTGVTSPWSTGIEVEEDYAAAISMAFDRALGKKESWYFLHTRQEGSAYARPIVTEYEDGRRIASIYATFHDNIWRCINTTESSDEFVSSVADAYLTDDGKDGQLIRLLDETDVWPVLLTHWQSLYSNGLRTGLRALDLVGQRIRRHLSERVEWTDFTGLMKLAMSETN